MTLQLRKKLPTTALNTKCDVFVRFAFALTFSAAFLLISSSQQSVGQTKAQQVGWSNRGAKTWANQAPRSNENVTSSRNLPWRRVQQAAGSSGTDAAQHITPQMATGSSPATGFTSSSPPTSGHIQEPIVLPSSVSPDPEPTAAIEPVKINRVEPVDYGSTIASVRQSLSTGGQRSIAAERYQPEAAQAQPANPFDDPFGDRSNPAPSAFGPPVAQPVSHLMQSAEPGNNQQSMISLMPFEEPVEHAVQQSRARVEGSNDEVQTASRSNVDAGLRLHSPARAFRKKKVALTVHSATGPVTPRVASVAPAKKKLSPIETMVTPLEGIAAPVATPFAPSATAADPPKNLNVPRAAKVTSSPTPAATTSPLPTPATSTPAVSTPAVSTPAVSTSAVSTPVTPLRGNSLSPGTVSANPTSPSMAPTRINVSPTMTPQISLPAETDDDTFSEMPEFPGYNADPSLPATPDSTEDSDNLDGLPALEEPPMPDGFESSAVEDGEELPDPDSDDPADQDDGDEDADADEDDEDDDEDDETKCGRIYNDRDCCDQDEICRNAWDRLNEISINDIGISISPPLAPLAEDDVEIEEQRERLQDAPFREFKNRFGNVVASGTLDDYVDGKIFIRTTDGGSVPIAFQDLGYDERCFVSSWWGIPTECLIRPGQVATRDWTKTTFTWKASSVCHKSLFFEDVQLERYGHSAGPVLQPLISGAHFFSNVAMIPYNAGVYPATECHYVLGYYRPGECAPWLLPAFPLSKRGAAMETAGLLGFFGVF